MLTNPPVPFDFCVMDPISRWVERPWGQHLFSIVSSWCLKCESSSSCLAFSMIIQLHQLIVNTSNQDHHHGVVLNHSLFDISAVAYFLGSKYGIIQTKRVSNTFDCEMTKWLSTACIRVWECSVVAVCLVYTLLLASPRSQKQQCGGQWLLVVSYSVAGDAFL